MTQRRVLFLGQKPVGEEAWRVLRARERGDFRIVAACSNAEPGRVWWQSATVHGDGNGVVFVDNASRNEERLLEVVRDLGVTTIFCVHHPWVLSSRILRAVDYEAITFHNARLPEYRGYNAVNHALLNRDETFACTVHWMADGVDEGAVIGEASFPIDPEETAFSLYAKAHNACVVLIDRVLDRLPAGEALPRRTQPRGGAFYSRSSIDGLREVRNPSERELKARAFYFPPFEPAYELAAGERHYVFPPGVEGSPNRPGRDSRALLDAEIARFASWRGYRCDL